MVSINITTPKEVKQLTYEEWQAFLQKIEDCTCTPGSALACPSCREYNRKKYGDSIPYGGNEWQLLKEMRENTDTEGCE